MCRLHIHKITAMNRNYPDTGHVPATTVTHCDRDEPFMDTRTTPSSRRGMALFGEPDGASLAGDTFPCAEVEGHISCQGYGHRGAPRPVRGLDTEARSLDRRGQGYRRALSAHLRVAEMDSEKRHRQRHALHRTCDGTDTGFLHIRGTGRFSRSLRRRHSRHHRGHFFRHLRGHFWGHISYR